MTAAERERMLATIAATFRRTAGLTGCEAVDPRVQAAMARIPRERFVGAEFVPRAHDDSALPIDCGQTISQPYIVALMSTLLQPRPHHRVLEVGTGSGYQAAVLAAVVGEVYSVEIVPELAQKATATLRELGCQNVHVRASDGACGWPEHAPYDGILVTCGSPTIPEALLAQLAPGGNLVIPVGPLYDQELVLVHKDRAGALHRRDVLGVRFVPFVQSVSPLTARYELFEHEADVGVRGLGPTKAAAFAQAARALTALVTDPGLVREQRHVDFHCEAPDDELLLTRWLNEVVYAMSTQKLLFARFVVDLHGNRLTATGFGEPVDRVRHEPAVEPKGATLTMLSVAPVPGGYRAQCVVDV